MNTKRSPRSIAFLPHLAAPVCAAMMFAGSAQAAFHLWSIRELYTNIDGTSQFIEFYDGFGGQQFVSNQQIQVVDQAGTTTHTFTIPPDDLPGDSFNHAFLIATSGFAASAGAVTPDYIIPDGFLFQGGGTINFFGLNSGGYTALPTNGILSRDFDGNTNQSNSPQNFAGSAGHVVPEPTSAVLLGVLGLGCCITARRRAA